VLAPDVIYCVIGWAWRGCDSQDWTLAKVLSLIFIVGDKSSPTKRRAGGVPMRAVPESVADGCDFMTLLFSFH
jgi:hypothetical protein